jgi:hypothetical protein
MLLTKNDISDFLHVARQDGSYIILMKNMIEELDRHEWSVIRAEYQHSTDYTELHSAKLFCEAILELLGVKTYYAESGMGLAIEIISKKKPIGPADQIAN